MKLLNRIREKRYTKIRRWEQLRLYDPSELRYSLTRSITLIVCALIAAFMIICLLLNITLLGRVYTISKQNQMVEAYNTINDFGNNNELDSDVLKYMLARLGEGDNMTIAVFDDNELVTSTAFDTDTLLQEFMDVVLNSDASEIVYEGDDYQVMRRHDLKSDSEYLVLAGVLENGNYVMIRTAVESINDSAAIANRFLFFVALIMIIVSFFVGRFVTKKITMPILNLCDLSTRMANLDFTARYQKRKKPNEIDRLGEHMNDMSDHLEAAIGELRSANEQLKGIIKEKERIDEMRKDFISNVSHELKTPIAIVQGYAEGLNECVNDDEESRQYYADVIIDEAEKMNHIVQELLALNQLEFGNEEVVMERFDIAELVNGVAGSMNLIMEQSGIEMSVEQSAPIYVMGDEFKVEEVLKNYLSNAMHHADGEKKVWITYADHGDKMRISVRNTGKQIPPEDLDKIWEKFYKVDKAHTREYGGSGVGLSIVKAIMDSFGQKCGVINRENGVEFWFELAKAAQEDK